MSRQRLRFYCYVTDRGDCYGSALLSYHEALVIIHGGYRDFQLQIYTFFILILYLESEFLYLRKSQI